VNIDCRKRESQRASHGYQEKKKTACCGKKRGKDGTIPQGGARKGGEGIATTQSEVDEGKPRKRKSILL